MVVRLYHATYRHLLPSIRLSGLGGAGIPNWLDSKVGVVYLATSQEVAESYAESADVPEDWLDSIVVLEIPFVALDQGKLGLDPNVQDNEGDTLAYSGVIPWASLTVI